MIANMIEIHGNSTGFDGGIFIASCDKSVPACLMGLARLDMPSIVVTGGVMDAGPDLLTLEQIGLIPPCAREGKSQKKSLLIINTTHVRPAAPAPSWGQPPPCRSWLNPWDLCFPVPR